ncbi:anaerobic ribonucleoside-triphosphate reductase activating protein [Thermosphaera chiliense]|uniref:Anaerobic ribonucleoside-triphosphate reductase activating protein n=1 Tax=Thermosphaera chiliense TaxID=3402707 RepID=A0A7M1UT51_9CREN|nr:anaerobic ribonucleoside-triphosphate reductase activating protein [Thermosphaera aggregans]QOR94787.1 anaerobic ribonucleoside-triphosphate reductase activating protein [Thermosphaera aggregans]
MTSLIYSSGWKNVSLIDVYNSVSFTLWLCGCNLKCPFCHNWRLAENDPGVCRWVSIDEVVESLSASLMFIDYLHVTGGEPLLQWRPLSKLFQEAGDSLGVKRSLNTNMTLKEPFNRLLEAGLVDHVATDLKLPYRELYGLPADVSDRLWENYLENLKLVSEHDIPLELRIPVSRLLKPEVLEESLTIIGKHLHKLSNLVIIIQPLMGPPVTTPRSVEWCVKNCAIDGDFLSLLNDVLRKHGFTKIAVREEPA